MEKFSFQNSSSANKTSNKGSDWEAEIESQKEIIQDTFGWYFLARECAEYARCSYFEILAQPAYMVAEIALLIDRKMELNKITNSKSTDPYR